MLEKLSPVLAPGPDGGNTSINQPFSAIDFLEIVCYNTYIIQVEIEF